MVHFLNLGRKIGKVLHGDMPGNHLDPLHNIYSLPLQLVNFFGIVGQEPDCLNPKILKDEGSFVISSRVRCVAKSEVGFNGVESLVLKVVGPNFVGENFFFPAKIGAKRE